jgi:AraC-like DNA-binding protein
MEVSPKAERYEHRTVPNGCAEIAYRRDTGSLMIAGPRSGPAVAGLEPGTTVVGLRLRPGAACVFAPAHELVDVEVELEAIWGPSARLLEERLAEAPSSETATTLLETELLARRAKARELDGLVAEAVRRLQPGRPVHLGAATGGLFISPRQLRRRFASAVGFGPKRLQRILRFQGFLALANAGGDVPLARFAAEAGYADQAHLTRECGRLSGLSPSAFLAETASSCGATHDHAASFAPLRAALLRSAAR